MRNVNLEEAIRTRRTHKAYGAEPVDRATLDDLFELARWAPNHHLTNPWRFRVLGPAARERLKHAEKAREAAEGGLAGDKAAAKLDRAPTLVVASVVGDDAEDRDATAVAAYLVLLAAHGRGLATYWRTPAVLAEPAGRAAVGVPDGEHVVGLLHLGRPRQEQRVPERAPVADVVTYLD